MGTWLVLAMLLTGQAPSANLEHMKADARLADVCFVDAQYGWAAGDRGTILHTSDGGEHWRNQPTPVSCPLKSVCFIDRKNGWAVGGFSHSYTHTSSGVILVTRDGGRSWQHYENVVLPALNKVRFFDANHGYALGARSAMYPAGAFVTDTGGKSWQPITGDSNGWLAGGFLDPNTGALAGRSGEIAAVRRGATVQTNNGNLGLRALRAMELLPPQYGWLVGDGGLVMMTADLGATWQTPLGEISPAAARHFDFAALSVRAAKIWIAGTPGTRVFRSTDAGRTWESFPTRSYVPLHGLFFVDDQHGWAVGELGTVLATEDGGQSWKRQRAGGTRAAMLGMFSSEKDIPLELFAHLSGDEGYLGAVELINRRDVEVGSREQTHPADRAHEALVGVGGSAVEDCWRFPLRQEGLLLKSEQLVDGWDRVNDSRGLQQLEAHLVRRIRMWRPDVIFTHDANPSSKDPLAYLVNQLVLQAVERAGDPTSFAEQITHAGLEPWRVKKVYAALPPGARSSNEIVTAKLAMRLGSSLDEVSAVPRGLLEDSFTAAPETLGFRLIKNTLPQMQGTSDFFSGISLPPGSDARRELGNPVPESIDMLRRIAQKRRNMRAILKRTDDDPRGGVQLLAQTGVLTAGMDKSSAGRILYHLGQRYYKSGKWSMAAETFELLVNRHPDHELARPASEWLLKYYASGEAGWRIYGKQRFTVHQASAPAIDQSKQEDRPGKASQWGKRVEQTWPDLFADPALRFPLAVAHRNQGYPTQAERFFMLHGRGTVHDAWWECAKGEQWLKDPTGLAPKKVLHCARAATKPKLDGKLDDAVWKLAKPADLKSAQHEDGQWPAAAMLAYDEEFLYIAINCRKAPGADYKPHEGPRPRDPDLSAEDRVDLLIDLDRDFSTWYRLTVDHAGRPSEGCWGDSSWDPTWFVAHDSTKDTWTAEAAIPLDELTGRFPATGTVWALGLQRIVPGAGFQSWSKPAAVDVVGEGFGYLIFE